MSLAQMASAEKFKYPTLERREFTTPKKSRIRLDPEKDNPIHRT